MSLRTNLLILLCFIGFFPLSAKANTVLAEVFLKKSTQRIERLLNNSLEAQVFLEEDLSGAIKAVKNGELLWVRTLSLTPSIFTDALRPVITLSENLSFKASIKDQLALTLEILFHLQRQLDGSTLPLPKTRIEFFAKKFAESLNVNSDTCSASLFTLPSSINAENKELFLKSLVPALEKNDYSYESIWGNKIIVLKSKDSTDAECGGKNRNLLNLKLYLVDLSDMTSVLLLDETGSSCGYSTDHQAKAIRKVTKQLKKKLPKCELTFGQN